MSTVTGGTFRSLRIYNYRVWAIGALVSNVGTWMQRMGQNWLVLVVLTPHNATAVGIVVSLQFGPQLLFLPWTGLAADRFDRRALLFVTQGGMGLLALGLGLLTVTGAVQLWHVYLFAFLLGSVSAFDAPARQTFVSELVGEVDLANAVALNSTSFNAARLIGPALAGGLIALIGTGWVFMINAASFVAVLASLALLRLDALHRGPRGHPGAGGLIEGFRYVRGRPDLLAILAMLFLIGTFGLNFAIFISTMSVSVFHAGAGQFGALTSSMAVGSVCGALMAARRDRPRIGYLVVGSAVFGAGLAVAAMAPGYWQFGLVLVLVGAAAQTVTTSAIGLIQLSTAPEMRGRVSAIFMAISLGATPLGSPLVGWVADRFGPRWGIGVGATAGVLAALIGLIYLRRVHAARARLTIEAPL